jgi:hypothetical protein
MPILDSRFRPPRWLRNPHLQTILPVLLPPRVNVPFERARLELADGDFLDLDWSRSGAARVAILSHGLEGCSRNGYIRGMAAALVKAGWDVLAWNFRGCGGEINRLPRFYHSGETNDLAAVITDAAERYAQVALVGFSLGGNVTLKYLGEAAAHPKIVAAAAISVPIDLASCARALDERRGNRIYLRRFLATLLAKAAAKALHFPEQLGAFSARRVRTIAEFDELVTAPLHGFRDAADYWARASARQFLPRIAVPTLLLNARDDPFLTASCFPETEAGGSQRLFLETPPHGGHVGFLDYPRRLRRWSEARVVEFLEQAISAPAR